MKAMDAAKALVAIAVSVVAAGAASCSFESSSAPPAVPVGGSEARLVGVVDEVRMVGYQSEFLADHLAADCMRAQGFDYWPYPMHGGEIPNPDFAELEFETSEEFWSVVEAADVEELDAGWGDDGDPNLSYLDGLDDRESSAYHDALIGNFEDPIVIETNGGITEMPSVGCLADARLQLFNGEAEIVLHGKLLYEFEDLLFELDDLVAAEPAYIEGGQELQRCIEGQGFTYPGVEMRIRSFISTTHGRAGTDAIFDCAQRLDLGPRLAAIEDAVGRDLIDADHVASLMLSWAEAKQEIFARLQAEEKRILGAS